MRVLIAGVLLLLSTHLAMAETRQNCAQTPGVNVVSWQSTLKDSERGWAVVKIDVPSGRTLSSAHATLGAEAGTTVADTAVYTALPYGPVTAGRYPLTMYATDSVGCTGRTYASRTVNVKQFIVPIAPPPSVPGVLAVCASGCQYALSQFQAALNAVQCGQTITIAAGQSVVGNFTLPNKGVCSSFITVTTDTPTNISADGVRVTAGQFAAMPKLQSTVVNSPVLDAFPSTNHWRFSGLEMWSSYSSLVNTVYALVFLGQDPANGDIDVTTLAGLPDAIEFKHCYFHGIVGANLVRAVSANATNVLVQDNYINEVHYNASDSQGVGWWNTPGPLTIRNNYISASGMPIMSGGSPAGIRTVVPADILIENNYFTKDPKWNPNDLANYAGIKYVSKNLSELKNATRVTFRHNILDNSFEPDQSGYCMTLTVRTELGVMTNAMVSHVEIGNNIFRNCRIVFNMQATDDDGTGSGGVIKIHNNLFYNIGTAISGGAGGLDISVNTENTVVFDHNTFVYGLSPDRIMTVGSYHPPPAVVTYDLITNFIMRNNLLVQGTYGIIGDNTAPGNSSIAAYLPASAITKNLLSGPDNTAIYPVGNLFAADAAYLANFVNPGVANYRLLNTSAYKNAGTDGQDLGYTPCNGLFPDPAGDGLATTICPAAAPSGFYLATNGVDGAGVPGTISQPWATFAYAFTRMSGGQTLNVRGGNYAQSITGTQIPSGTSDSARTIIKAYQASGTDCKNASGRGTGPQCEVVTLNGTGGISWSVSAQAKSFHTIDGINVDAVNFVADNQNSAIYCSYNSSNITYQNATVQNVRPGTGVLTAFDVNGNCDKFKLLNNIIKNNGRLTDPGGLTAQQHGAYLGTTNALVEGNDMFGNGGYGLQIQSGADVTHTAGAIVRKNQFHNNCKNPDWGCGELTIRGNICIVYNNRLFQDGGGQGASYTILQLFEGSVKAANNVIYGDTKSSPAVQVGANFQTPNGTILVNNVVFGNTNNYNDLGTGTVLTTNWNLPSGVADPLFVNSASGDFHLQAASVAKVGGTTVIEVSDDSDGIVRPQGATYSRGAYEVVAP